MIRGDDQARRRRRPHGPRGASAVEILVAVLVVAAVGIPMLSVLFQGRDTEQRSRFEWLAVLAARDEIYQARLLAACGATPASLAHEDRPQAGNPLDPVRGLFTGDVPDVTYAPVQERVQTRVVLRPAPDGASPRLTRGTVTARWRDEEAARREKRKTSIDIHFGVVTPP